MIIDAVIMGAVIFFAIVAFAVVVMAIFTAFVTAIGVLYIAGYALYAYIPVGVCAIRKRIAA